MAVHQWMNLRDAARLETEQYQLIDRIVFELASIKAMVVAHGPAGTGKTFAVECAIEHLRSHPVPGLSIYLTKAPHGGTLRRVSERLWYAISGEELPAHTRFRHMDSMRKALARGRSLLVIDEAQNLSAPGIELIRELYDERDTTVSVLLVGGDGTWETISAHPMLRSRILWRVVFNPLLHEQMTALMPDYHPIYRDAPDSLISEIDDEVVHGNLRDLAALTFTLARLAEPAGRTTVDDELLDNAYLMLGGVQRAARA